MRGFVSVALCVELVESSSRVVKCKWGRGWLKRSAGSVGWIDFGENFAYCREGFLIGG